MRVRMKATLSGTRDGEPWPERGGIVDLSDDEAQHLIRAGIAEEDQTESAPESEPEVETATAPDEAEKAVPARQRRK
ncbi:hypothetical protein [Streptomyces sp. NPDC055055]